MRKDYEKGQILLIVVLIMVTTLTIGLSVATRTITNLRTTQEEASSERAFSAAEAGIEQSLTNNIAASGSFTNSASYKTSVITIAGVDLSIKNGAPIFKDDAVDVWLSNYPTYANPWSGNVTLYWGKSSDTCATSETNNTMAALEVVLLSGTKANPKITHFAVDPCAQRASNNKFEVIPAGGGTVNGKTFAFKKTITVASGLLLRVISLYAPTVLAVKGCDSVNNNCAALPSQGSLIEAVGTSDNTERKIVSFRGYPKLPLEIFPFVLFAPK